MDRAFATVLSEVRLKGNAAMPTENVNEMCPFTRFDHVQVAMPPGGEARAREFYAEILGFHEIPKPPDLAQRGGAWFRSGEVQLHLGVDSDFRPAKKAHAALRCTDYATLIARLKADGVTVAADANLADGSEHCYIGDPFGNRIELIAENASGK